jgi:hypothetical protein
MEILSCHKGAEDTKELMNRRQPRERRKMTVVQTLYSKLAIACFLDTVSYPRDVIAGRLTCREAAAHRSPGQGEASLSELRRRPGYRTAVSTSAERPTNHSSKSLPRPTQSKVAFHGFGLGNVVCAGRGFCSADVPLTFETQGGGQTRGARPSLPWAAILIPCGEPMPRRSWSSSRTSVFFVLSGLILFGCGR